MPPHNFKHPPEVFTMQEDTLCKVLPQLLNPRAFRALRAFAANVAAGTAQNPIIAPSDNPENDNTIVEAHDSILSMSPVALEDLHLPGSSDKQVESASSSTPVTPFKPTQSNTHICDLHMHEILPVCGQFKEWRLYNWKVVRQYAATLQASYGNIRTDTLRQKVNRFRPTALQNGTVSTTDTCASLTSSSITERECSNFPNERSRETLNETVVEQQCVAEFSDLHHTSSTPAVELLTVQSSDRHTLTAKAQSNSESVGHQQEVTAAFPEQSNTLRSTPAIGLLPKQSQTADRQAAFANARSNTACENCRKRKKGCDGSDKDCSKKRARTGQPGISTFFAQSGGSGQPRGSGQ
ncbi:hypothetical protein DFJ73DRAFT_960991 [Zopfochytrium polystomum]|nr:hypothetical protein DFJ73DRAFT_960991 [Zopfochytrium polystomum]